MYSENNSVFVEDEDLCKKCKYFVNDVKCPLLQALSLGLASLNEPMQVTNCELYKPENN